jgi:hypothetical protein
MKSKIVENWLTKVKELTFTIPFCQILLSEGKRVVHISSQGPGEQGKDIIAVDNDGVIHCYQLKCGNINSRTWAEIKAEIDQLVELPPRHPSLPHNVEHWEAYLVTNGNIANPTARDITDYAEIKKKLGHQALKSITGRELLSSFTNLYDQFLPIDTFDLQRFLEIYNENGDFELDVAKMKVFFEAFFQSHSEKSRQKKVEALQASLILCNYMLTNKYERENHLEIIKAYTLLLASIYDFAERNDLADNLWRSSEELIYDAIETECKQLIDELGAHEHHYVQAEYGLLSESLVHKIRCSELAGYLSSYWTYCVLRGKTPYEVASLEKLLAELYSHRTILAERFVPLFINYIVNLHHRGKTVGVTQALTDLLDVFVVCHGPDEGRGLPSPYYGINDCVNWVLQRNDNIRETFRWRSFTLRPILLIAARYGLRDAINDRWSILSRISQHEMLPSAPPDYFMWRMIEGEQADRYPDISQSWSRLVAEADVDHSGDLPRVLQKRRHFLPLLINVMPHRANHRFVLCTLHREVVDQS